MSGSLNPLRAGIVALVSLLGVMSGALPASGADAPAPDTAMRGESARGVAAAGRCASEVWSPEDYASCIDTLVDGAMNRDAAKAPFQLGVYCASFHALALAYRQWRRKPAQGPAVFADGGLLRETTLDEFDSCLFQARRANVAAHQICSGVGLNCTELNPLLDHWRTVARKDQ